MTIETEDVVADVLAAFKALRSDHLPTLEELARTAVAATPSERLREENARREWQLIETAPPNSDTEVDLWVPGKGRLPNCHFHCGQWLWWTTRGDEEPTWQVVQPTHWMTLPEPPRAALTPSAGPPNTGGVE
jgi:hypothetical protein